MGLQGEGGFKRGLKGASEGFQGLEKGLKGVQGEEGSRRVGGGFRRASEGFKGASERFEGGLSKVRKVLEKSFERVAPPDHLRLKPITCASNSAPQPTHLRPPPCLPQCHALNSEFLPPLPSTMP